MALGNRDTQSLVMMTGWDATVLQNFQLQDGTTIETVAKQLNAALGALNQELSGGLWGGLVSYQSDPDLEYRVGSSNGFQDHTEYGTPDAKRAETEGHMLPFKEYDRGLGWTFDYLKRARMSQIQADIADAIKDARDIWRQKILARCLQRGDDSGTNKGLGTGGYSVGFATAAASTNVDFVPPANAGTTFTSAHEHYVGIAGGVFTNAVFSDAKDELREHGHEPSYEFLISPTDEAEVKALTDFTEAPASLVAYGANQALATVPTEADMIGGYYIGTIHDFAIRVVRGMPADYGFGYKSYGNLSQRNPLRIRADKGVSAPMVIAANDPRNGSPAHPLQFLMLQVGFGVGVADRTAATARYVDNATWADGTPT
ncbi:MAG: hypothetical protein GY927_03905 [bacterium]|nr:hypothetical protein [bacterium]